MSRKTGRASLLGVMGAALALAGCGGDTVGPNTAQTFTVFGYLYVGETIDAANAIHVARVQPIATVYDPAAAAVSNAIVTLSRAGAPADTLDLVAPGAYADSAIVVVSQTTYRLRIEIPGESALTAATTTPVAVEITGGPPELPQTVRHDVLQDAFPVLVRCDDPDQILLTDVYCLEDWHDARYIASIGPRDKPESYDEYGGDNREPRHIFAFFRADDVVREGDQSLINFYGAMMAFYGRYQVHISSIDANVYDFLYKDHPEENGGIVGGIGVFGSACRRSWNVEVTP
ncbi:MAG: DUF4249 family protein [bacterium]